MLLRFFTIIVLIIFKYCFEELKADVCVNIAVQVLPPLDMNVIKYLWPDTFN